MFRFRLRPRRHLTEAPRTRRHLVSTNDDKELTLPHDHSWGSSRGPVSWVRMVYLILLHLTGFMPALWIQLSAIWPNELHMRRPPRLRPRLA